MPPLDRNGNGATPTVSRATLMARLREFGVSGAGAQQAIDGQVLSNPQDRTIIAGILGRALGPTAATSEFSGESTAFEMSSPGGSKVTTRLRVENF
jgi:hypothetical protein